MSSVSPSGQSDQSAQYEDAQSESEFFTKDVTVKFLVDNAQCLAQTYPNTSLISEIKKDIAGKFQVQVEDIVFKQGNQQVIGGIALCNAEQNEFGVIEIQLELTDDAIDNDVTLDTNVYYSQFPLNDIITVHVPVEMTRDGCAKDLIVEIENKPIAKPFVGGYRNVYTGIEYYDAFSQTGPSEKVLSRLADKLTRDTQTVDLVAAAAVSTPSSC